MILGHSKFSQYSSRRFFGELALCLPLVSKATREMIRRMSRGNCETSVGQRWLAPTQPRTEFARAGEQHPLLRT